MLLGKSTQREQEMEGNSEWPDVANPKSDVTLAHPHGPARREHGAPQMLVLHGSRSRSRYPTSGGPSSELHLQQTGASAAPDLRQTANAAAQLSHFDSADHLLLPPPSLSSQTKTPHHHVASLELHIEGFLF